MTPEYQARLAILKVTSKTHPMTCRQIFSAVSDVIPKRDIVPACLWLVEHRALVADVDTGLVRYAQRSWTHEAKRQGNKPKLPKKAAQSKQIIDKEEIRAQLCAALKEMGWACVQDVMDATGLSDGTVRGGLSRFRVDGLVDYQSSRARRTPAMWRWKV